MILLVIASCLDDDPVPETLFEEIDASRSGLSFINKVTDRSDQNIFSYRNFYNGGGVGLGDFDRDGFLDIYFTGNQVPNKLYHNQGEFVFSDITSMAGVAGKDQWATGVAVADVNADGWLDIYVCYSGPDDGQPKQNELFINQGDLTFEEAAEEYRLDDAGFGTHALFFDYDLDNDLDCFVLNNSLQTPDRIRFSKDIGRETDLYSGDQLYRNDQGVYKRVTQEAGIMASKIGFGLGASIADFNQDGFPDIYVSNDFWERDYCYVNQGNGTFTEVLTSLFDYSSMSSMGSDVGDVDNDGDLDLFTTDMLPLDQHRIQTMTEFENEIVRDPEYLRRYHRQYLQNCLQLNAGQNGFVEVARQAGVAASDWSWGALIFDLDLDGWKDIFVANGVYRDITDLDFRDYVANGDEVSKAIASGAQLDLVNLIGKMPSDPRTNCAFRNLGDGIFEDQATQLGLGSATFSNGAAYGDLDNDGDHDLVINNVNMPVSLYRSSASEKAHWLQVILHGPMGNQQGIGAEVILYARGLMQSATVVANRGFQSSVDSRLLFGLGDLQNIDSLTLTWPDGRLQRLGSTAVDSTLLLTYESASPIEFKKQDRQISLLRALDPTQVFHDKIPRHVEDDFDDFDVEGLLPHRLSNMGPKLAVADVDKNGFEDLLLLGATGQEDQLYLQLTDGTFKLSEQPALAADRTVESSCALFFDADNDNDHDLIIGCGGNNLSLGSKSYYARYYLNDGQGNFKKVIFEAPAIVGNISCIKSADIDQDGDLDLFAGGLCVPGNYGLVPRSFLIRNDGGVAWTDITSQGIGQLGMVTDAEWIRDPETGYSDLLVVGEWMPITILINRDGTLVDRQQIPNTAGWWQSITPVDLDGDRTMEYVLGNWGQNSRIRATPESPVTMHVSDFDQNGKSEFVISAQTGVDDRPYPIASRMALTKQLPELRRRASSFHKYAGMQYEDLFSKEQRAAAKSYEMVEMRTGTLVNEEGAFQFKPLPIEAQRAPVFGAVPIYGSELGATALLLVGNQSGLPPFLGSQSASRGDLFVRGQKDTFHYVNQGLGTTDMRGDVRDAVRIAGPMGEKVIVARNNDALMILEHPRQ